MWSKFGSSSHLWCLVVRRSSAWSVLNFSFLCKLFEFFFKFCSANTFGQNLIQFTHQRSTSGLTACHRKQIWLDLRGAVWTWARENHVCCSWDSRRTQRFDSWCIVWLSWQTNGHLFQWSECKGKIWQHHYSLEMERMFTNTGSSSANWRVQLYVAPSPDGPWSGHSPIMTNYFSKKQW